EVVVVVGPWVVVVVAAAPVTVTEQPLPPVMVIGLADVSKRLRIVSPMFVEPLAPGATSNVTLATLTTPTGPPMLNCWSPEIGVDPLLNVAELVVGWGWNSAVLPPTTALIVSSAGSYVIVTPYAPSGVVPTSIVISTWAC